MKSFLSEGRWNINSPPPCRLNARRVPWRGGNNILLARGGGGCTVDVCIFMHTSIFLFQNTYGGAAAYGQPHWAARKQPCPAIASACFLSYRRCSNPDTQSHLFRRNGFAEANHPAKPYPGKKPRSWFASGHPDYRAASAPRATPARRARIRPIGLPTRPPAASL